ncbi:hypothetical protein DU002_11240 [Corallincola holothuriorum]|uniref:Uncharacterized protein n=2 Tax=Corallincola TaxID=1775176 RepID=A0A368NJ89_9GAMM|nr:hypothetical protein DU002_11240 [Corallincola holothuriorum]TAA47780.1 hypothetical protein EXY25_00575 [Corallincola spongiicola]
MSNLEYRLSVAEERKLLVIIRVEPGCLGPDGADHIEGFCQLAQLAFEPRYAGIIRWQVVPRYDKSLPELQYLMANKNLAHEQVEKVLDLINLSLDDFEIETGDRLSMLIDKTLRR